MNSLREASTPKRRPSLSGYIAIALNLLATFGLLGLVHAIAVSSGAPHSGLPRWFSIDELSTTSYVLLLVGGPASVIADVIALFRGTPNARMAIYGGTIMVGTISWLVITFLA